MITRYEGKVEIGISLICIEQLHQSNLKNDRYSGSNIMYHHYEE